MTVLVRCIQFLILWLQDFEISLGNAAKIGVISIDGDWVRLSQDTKSINFFVNFMAPFVPAYLSLSEALLEVCKKLEASLKKIHHQPKLTTFFLESISVHC